MDFWRRRQDRPSVQAADTGRESEPDTGRSWFSASRRVSGSLLVASLAFLALPTFGTAQGPRRPSQPLQELTRALVEGRYDQVDSLAEKLDVRDPLVVALKARAAIARGHYAEAEAALRPAAAKAPASDAALELGLLHQMLGRPEAEPVLGKVAAPAETSDDPAELARAARALRALGEFRPANDAYRLAASRTPADPAINTAWGELFLEKFNKAEALKSFQAALQADPAWAPALLGSARALADENPPQAVALANLSGFPQGQWGQAKVEADAEKGPGKSRRDERPDAAVLERASSLDCPLSLSHAPGREEQGARSPERAVRDPRHDFLTRQRAFYDPRLTGQNDFVEFHALSPEVSRGSA